MADSVVTAEHPATWQKSSTWLRGLFMLAVIVAMGIVGAVVNFVALVQFLWLVFVGDYNRWLQGFGTSLASWLVEATHFLTGLTEQKPFPWKAWPSQPTL